MPALPRAKAKSVAQAESKGPSALLELGVYPGKLIDVTVVAGKAASQWNTQWEVRFEGAKYTLWERISLSEAAEWKMKEFFEAFGVPPTTNTDELLGETIDLQVGVETIQAGKRKGEETNSIEAFLPPGAEDGEEEEELEDDDEELEDEDPDESEDEEDLEEDEEEPEPPPPPKRKKAPAPAPAPAPAKTKRRRAAAADDEPPF